MSEDELPGVNVEAELFPESEEVFVWNIVNEKRKNMPTASQRHANGSISIRTYQKGNVRQFIEHDLSTQFTWACFSPEIQTN